MRKQLVPLNFILKAPMQKMGRSMLIRIVSMLLGLALSTLFGVGNSLLRSVACWVMDSCRRRLQPMIRFNSVG